MGIQQRRSGDSPAGGPNTGFVAVAAGESHSLAIRRMPGDADANGNIDGADFTVFADYLDGPFVVPQWAGWPFYDSDH